MNREQPDILIDRIAGSQHGVVARVQLAEAGLSGRTIERRIASGRLTRIFRGVYRAGPIAGRHVREAAALLVCGSEALLSHRTAGVLWELVVPARACTAVEVSVPRTVRRRVSGIVAHRSRDLTPADVARLDGLPLTTPARTLLDLAAGLTSGELERAIGRAEHKGRVSEADLLRRASASPRHHGARIIRQLLAAEGAPAFTRSEAESRLLELIRRARLRRPRLNARVCGYEVDFLWTEERLVAEVDGWAWHASPAAFARDRRRDADLHASGFRVVRFTWDDVVKRPEATIGVLAAALARA